MGEKKEEKVKRLSERDIEANRIKEDTDRIIGEMEQLAPGQTLIYRLPEFYWSGFAAFLIAELNPSYPQKGRKFILSTDKIADGKPTGKKMRSFESNKPKDFAEWVSQRHGERYM